MTEKELDHSDLESAGICGWIPHLTMWLDDRCDCRFIPFRLHHKHKPYDHRRRSLQPFNTVIVCYRDFVLSRRLTVKKRYLGHRALSRSPRTVTCEKRGFPCACVCVAHTKRTIVLNWWGSEPFCPASFITPHADLLLSSKSLFYRLVSPTTLF